MNLCIVVILVVVIILLCYLLTHRENFQGSTPSVQSSPTSASSSSNESNSHYEDLIMNHLKQHAGLGESDESRLISKTEIEMVAQKAANSIVDNLNKNCPADFNGNDWVRKTDIEFQKNCPVCPDLKDYVLKSTIPPVQKCPPCICPKVKVEAGLCKKCPEPKNNCPKPQPCDELQCKDVIKCEPNHKQVSCPECPAPQPCPKPVEKLCPAIDLPDLDVKCPSPQPCPLPEKCPDGQGRCPEEKCPSCEFKGVETITQTMPVEELVNDLLFSDDPQLKELLNLLKYKLSLNQNPSPTEMSLLNDKINSIKNVRGRLQLPNESTNNIPNSVEKRVNGGNNFLYGANNVN